jgi:hypothetical protein
MYMYSKLTPNTVATQCKPLPVRTTGQYTDKLHATLWGQYTHPSSSSSSATGAQPRPAAHSHYPSLPCNALGLALPSTTHRHCGHTTPTAPACQVAQTHCEYQGRQSRTHQRGQTIPFFSDLRAPSLPLLVRSTYIGRVYIHTLPVRPTGCASGEGGGTCTHVPIGILQHGRKERLDLLHWQGW